MTQLKKERIDSAININYGAGCSVSEVAIGLMVRRENGEILSRADRVSVIVMSAKKKYIASRSG